MISEILQEKGMLERVPSVDSDKLEAVYGTLSRSRNVYITGSGSSYHASLYLSILLMRKGITAIPLICSEMPHIFTAKGDYSDSTILFFSQSGEGTDILRSVELSRELNLKSIGITNVKDSILDKSVDASIITRAGTEESVAATKSHFAQLIASLDIAYFRETEKLEKIYSETRRVLELILSKEDKIRKMAEALQEKTIFLGSGLLYPVSLEGALKFKETSNSIAEGYPRREFLHGPKQILSKEWSCFLLTEDSSLKGELAPLTGSFIDVSEELRSLTGGRPSTEESDSLSKLVLIQLLSYYKALNAGLDPDNPSKLKKVVV